MSIKFLIFSGLVFMAVHSKVTIAYGQLQMQSVASKSDNSISGSALPDLETQLIDIESIINIAIHNSPYIKGDSLAIVASKYNVTLARKNFHDNLSVFGNLAGGSQSLGVSSTTTGQNNLLNGYRYGVNVAIPISEFTLRRLRVKQAQAQVNSLELRKQQAELELRRQVILEYNNLIAAQKLLKIKSESLENFRVLYQLGEKQFRDGTTQLEDYAFVSDMSVKAETEHEFAKSNFKTLYSQFEFLVGVELTKLMKGR